MTQITIGPRCEAPTSPSGAFVDRHPHRIYIIIIYNAPPLVMLYSIVQKYQHLRGGCMSGYLTQLPHSCINYDAAAKPISTHVPNVIARSSLLQQQKAPATSLPKHHNNTRTATNTDLCLAHIVGENPPNYTVVWCPKPKSSSTSMITSSPTL